MDNDNQEFNAYEDMDGSILEMWKMHFSASETAEKLGISYQSVITRFRTYKSLKISKYNRFLLFTVMYPKADLENRMRPFHPSLKKSLEHVRSKLTEYTKTYVKEYDRYGKSTQQS